MKTGLVLAATLGWCGGSARAQWLAGASLAAADHRVDAGLGLERATGLMAGAAAGRRLGGRLDVTIDARSGRLQRKSPTGSTLDVGELGATARWWVRRAVALESGFTVRGYSADVARERWELLRVGATWRVPFSGGGVSGVLRGDWLPGVWVNGLPHPSSAFAASAGTEYTIGPFVCGVRYDLERYDFPSQGGVARREQLTALTVSAQLKTP